MIPILGLTQTQAKLWARARTESRVPNGVTLGRSREGLVSSGPLWSKIRRLQI